MNCRQLSRVNLPRSVPSCLVGLALLLSLVFAAPASASTSGNFKTPSGNIVCAYLYGRNVQLASVLCGIKSGLKPAPPRNGTGCKVLDYQATGSVWR